MSLLHVLPHKILYAITTLHCVVRRPISRVLTLRSCKLGYTVSLTSVVKWQRLTSHLSFRYVSPRPYLHFMSRLPPAKKPTGSRPLRTASVDSTASEKSQQSTSTLPGESRKLSKPSALNLGDVDEAVEDPEPFYGNHTVDSPIEVDFSGNKDTKPQHLDIISPHPQHPDASAEPPSPSRARWDSIRRHIMHSPSPSVTPPLAPSLQSIPKPFAPQLPVGGRPGTPKSSRFPRLGMRQVVDTAREIAIDDMRKFALELERACVQLRALDVIHNKSIWEGSIGGSALSLSLPHSSGVASTIPSNNLSKQSTGSIIAPPQPSLLTLLRTLEQYEASLLHLPRTLPLENQVLSALLVPFMLPEPLEQEQEYAFRAFSLIIKTWRTDSQEVRRTSAFSMAPYRCFWRRLNSIAVYGAAARPHDLRNAEPRLLVQCLRCCSLGMQPSAPSLLSSYKPFSRPSFHFSQPFHPAPGNWNPLKL